MKSQLKIATIVGLALVLSATILGVFFYQARQPQHTASVTGSASAEFEADTVKWSITLRETATPNQIKEGYLRLEESTKKLLSELQSKGITKNDITVKPINAYKEYDNTGFSGYNLEQSIMVISTDIDKIESWALSPSGLLESGIIIQYSNLEYFYSDIDNLKKDLISDATVNARDRAQKMLVNTDLTLGKIRSIRSGVFQITEPYSTMVSSSGIYDTSTRDKQISITVHAVFELK